MQNSYLTDFHHGWLIEVAPLEQGFKATCYSPCRQRFVIQNPGSSFDTLNIAKQAINHQVACSTVSGLLRDFYEAGQLGFEEWTALHHSLTHVIEHRK